MVDCDNFMNVTLRDVYLTSPDGEKFWKLKEVYVKGNVVSQSPSQSLAVFQRQPLCGLGQDQHCRGCCTSITLRCESCKSLKHLLLHQIKYLRVADQILDQVQEEQQKYRMQARGGNQGNGARGGRGKLIHL